MLSLIFLLGVKSLKMLNLFSYISQKNKIKILLWKWNISSHTIQWQMAGGFFNYLLTQMGRSLQISSD